MKSTITDVQNDEYKLYIERQVCWCFHGTTEQLCEIFFIWNIGSTQSIL